MKFGVITLYLNISYHFVWVNLNKVNFSNFNLLVINDLKRGRTYCNVPFRLKLIIGAQVILLKNIDIENGLIYGTHGILKEFIQNTSEIIVTIIIDFDS
jgi:hypothetical protein